MAEVVPEAVMLAAIDQAVSKHVEPLRKSLDDQGDKIESIERTVVGNEREGNPGILARMTRTERRVGVMLWLLPVWITAGTSFGTVLIKWWGI